MTDLEISSRCAVFVARSFEVPQRDEPIDALKRARTVRVRADVPHVERHGASRQVLERVALDHRVRRNRDELSKLSLEDAIEAALSGTSWTPTVP